MKKIVLSIVLMFVAEGVGHCDEWVPYGSNMLATPVQKIEYVPYYYNVPYVTMVPLVKTYVPIVKYENRIVEVNSWCCFKNYQVVAVPQIVYVPITQTYYRY